MNEILTGLIKTHEQMLSDIGLSGYTVGETWNMITQYIYNLQEDNECLEHNLKVCQDFSDRGFYFSVKTIDKLEKKLNTIQGLYESWFLDVLTEKDCLNEIFKVFKADETE